MSVLLSFGYISTSGGSRFFSRVANSEDDNDRKPTIKPAMLKLLTVTALIVTLYVIESNAAAWEVIKNPPPMSKCLFAF